MDEVYVVEIAATGPKGMPSDTVVQIGICRMLADGSDFDTVYDATVALDPKDLGKESLDYMMECHGIAPEELYVGVDEKTVVSEVQGIIFRKECASYNVGNVFGKYLNFEPWDCTRNLTLLPSISMRLDRDLKGPPEREHELIRKAYDTLCPGDPACVGDGRRAVDLAQMATSVLMRLRSEGWYRRPAVPTGVRFQNTFNVRLSMKTRNRHPRYPRT